MRQSILVLSILIAAGAGAQSVREIVPSSAPQGARVIVSGTQLDGSTIAVTFAGSGGTRVAATIQTRNDRFIEVTVSERAVSGGLTLTSGNTTVGTLAFTVAPDVPWQTISTIAGRLQSTGLKQPQGIAIDPKSGNVYIADTHNHQIKVLSPDGTLTVLAGRGAPGLKDGTGADAELKQPRGLAFDPVRNILYVADSSNHVIRRMTTDGVVTTLAGDGKSGDLDGTGSAARFKRPCAVAVDEQGNIYIADTDNHKIRRATPAGVVTTIAGTGGDGYADGAALSARFAGPEGIAFAGGIVYVADTGNHRIRKIENGTVSLIAGDGRNGFADGAAEIARFDKPAAVVAGEGGMLFVADSGNGLIRRIAAGNVLTIAGRLDGPKNDVYDGPPLSASLHQPSALAFAGALYVADTKNDAARLIKPELRLADLYPRRGALAGGNQIHLLGAGFIPAITDVKVGGVTAPQVTFVTSTLLLVTMPAGTAGNADISVTRLGDTRTLTGRYTYLPPPTITSIAPNRGKAAGGEPATVRGTDFMADETEILFGTNQAPQVIVNDPTSASVTTPAGSPGVVGLLARTPGGEARLENAFRFFAPPVLTGFAPPSGQAGTVVTITGNHFDTDAPGNAVRFGSFSASTVSASATSISTIVPAGAVTSRISVTTAGGTAISAADFIVPVLTSITITPPSVVLEEDETRQLAATGNWSDGSSRDVTSLAAWSSGNGNIATVSTSGSVRAESAGTTAITATLDGVTGTANVKVETNETLPPPTVDAPPLSDIEVTPVSKATEFLYSGPDAVQTGVAPNAFDPERAAVVRGIVTTRDGQPLTGVGIAIAGAPQYGSTHTREDGWFDMAVNGDGRMIITYQKTGYLPVQRVVSVPWQDYLIAPGVVMIPLDDAPTAIQSNSAAQQVARGSVSEDEDGPRQATLIFPPQTEATMVMPDGTTQPLPSLTIRATEYTIGVNGRNAMPAALPPTSGYTYCVELSADEAIAAGATDVRFTKPIALYVENFLAFPVGGIVPAGYFDRQKGIWIPSDNGRVIRVLNVSSPLAEIDINGDGAADSAAALAALGIDDAERQRLTALYTAGTSLWRVPITHFTPWDANWPFGPPSGATAPSVPPPTTAYWIRGGRTECGSIINCHNQTLGESISVPGVPFSLTYNTGRVMSDDRRTLSVPISGATVPPGVKRFVLEIEWAGRKVTKTYAAAPSLHDEIQLDLRDAYGRPLTGAVRAQVRLGYVYAATYMRPADFEKSFGAASGIPVDTDRFSLEVTLGKNSSVNVTTGDVRPLGTQGWSLDNHHVYDFVEQTMYQGDGSRRTSVVSDPRSHVLRTVAGTGRCCAQPVGGAARELPIQALNFRIAPNGDIYLNEWDFVRRVDRNGTVMLVAGSKDTFDDSDGPATQRRIRLTSIAIGPDGALYLNEGDRIRVVRNGMLHTIAGGGAANTPNRGDGLPARQAVINAYDISVGPDSSVYLIDRPFSTITRKIRRIFPDGIIRTIAGGGTDTRDRIPATQADLPSYGIVVGEDETIYLLDSNHWRIRTIGTDGIVRTIAGRQNCSFNAGSTGDGGRAVDACIPDPFDVALDRNGVVYITEFSTGRIRAVTPDGLINTVAGNGEETNVVIEGGAATGSPVTFPWSVAVGPDGMVYFTEEDTFRLRRIEPVLPKFSLGERFIASPTGNEMYVFSGSRHVRTVDASTQSPLYSFSYDAAGRVAAITDVDGGVTRLERDGSGKLTEVVAPTGERTAIQTNAAGQLTSITTGTAETRQFGYSTDGRLTSMKTPRGHTYRFEYDADGKLTKDSNPAGGFIRLFRTGSDNDITYNTTTAMGRTKSDRITRFANGSERRIYTTPSGLRVTTDRALSGNTVTNYPDGSIVSVAEGPDARFGMQAAIPASTTMTTPGGRVWSRSMKRFTTGGELTPTSLIEQLIINGRTYTTTFDVASRVLTELSPEGRQVLTAADAQGRVTSTQMAGLAAVGISYTQHGHVSAIQQGGRATRFGYDALDRVISTTDSLNRTITFGYDGAGRVISQMLPGGREIRYGYDQNGNLTSIQPPGRDPHLFTYTAADQGDSYQAPAAAGSANMTQFAFNPDGQMTSVSRPDGTLINFLRDGNGRITGVRSATASIDYGYLSSGNLATITAPGVSLSYIHDGPLVTRTAWSGAISGNVTWIYDNDFQVTSQSVNGAPVSFAYSADSLLTRAGALTLTYHPQNRLLTGTTLDRIADSYSYNEFGEVTAYRATWDGTPLLSIDYTRDTGGRITAIGSRGFEYDGAGRLARVTNDGAAVAEYSYDANNNRTEHRWTGGSNSGSYDPQDRLLRYGQITYEYTASGELKSRTVGGETTAFEYDVMGGLRRVVEPHGRTIEYVIDGQNRRVGKKVNGTLVQGWLYAEQLRVVAETDGTGSVVSRFVYASRQNVPDYMIRGGATYRILADHLGSPRLIVNTADGTIMQRIDYDEFGRVLSDTSPGFQPFGFAGGLYDRDTGLLRFGARDYDPHTGRWTAKEPLGFAGGMNFYVYASGDPLNLFDPDGLQTAPAATQTFQADMTKSPLKELWANPEGAQAINYAYPPGYPKTNDQHQQCVAATRHFTGAPCTACWRRGPKIAGSNFPIGTATAAGWVNGRYLSLDSGNNSGVYGGTYPDGSILLIDQWKTHRPMARVVSPGGDASNDADAYYVITVPPGATPQELATCSCKN